MARLPRKLHVALLLIPVGLGGLLLVSPWFRPFPDAPERRTVFYERQTDPIPGPERARRLEALQKTQGHRTDDRIRKALERDAGYGEALLKVDRTLVDSLEGLSPEEKNAMWRVVQSAQDLERRRISDGRGEK